MSGSNREMTPLTPREWERAGEHYRAAFDAIVRLGNALLAMKAPAKAKAVALRLREVAWDRALDMGLDLVHDAERQGYGERAYSAIVGRDEDRVPLHLTDRKLVMDRRRWAELGDEMLSCLEHTKGLLRLVGPSLTLARGDRHARQLRRLEKLRSALDDLVVAMEPDWGNAVNVFYRGRDGDRVMEGLGLADPARTIAAFFCPMQRG